MNESGMAFEEPAPRRAHATASRIPDYLLAALIAVLAGAIVILASVPPVDRDALTHHLAVPKLYLKHGGMVEIPSVLFSYYPMNLDLLYLVPLFFGNDIVPKYIHFAFGLLAAILIHRYLAGRLGSRLFGMIGALLFLSLPVVIKLSITVYVDLGLIFFSTAALLGILKWAESGFRARQLVLAGAFCGLALGTKYNALIAFFLLACLIPVLYMRNRPPAEARAHETVFGSHPGAQRVSGDTARGLGFAALFIAVALAVFSPWMIRNTLWTGNPIYPLYDRLFSTMARAIDPAGGPQSRPPEMSEDGEAGSGTGHLELRRLVFNESALETFTIPLRIFFQGEDDNPRYFDGRLNPYLCLLPAGAFLGFRRLSRRLRNENIALAGFSIAFLLYAFFTADMRIRYIGPILPPLVILATIGLHNLANLARTRMLPAHRRLAPIVLGLVVALLLAQNLRYLVGQFNYVRPFGYLSGEVRRDDYIARFRSDYPAFQFINRHLSAEVKLLGLYMGNRLYYADRELFFGDQLFENTVATSDSGESLARVLRAKGFTHLFVRWDVLEDVARDSMSAQQARVLMEFLSAQTRSLFSEGFYHVLELAHAP
jgi:4-amino-4-deoxy-L-arabinose transferase-like glycosyltransferase